MLHTRAHPRVRAHRARARTGEQSTSQTFDWTAAGRSIRGVVTVITSSNEPDRVHRVPTGASLLFCIFRSSNVSEKKEIYKERRIAPVGELCELSGIATTNDSDTTPLYIARAMRTHTRLYNTYI